MLCVKTFFMICVLNGTETLTKPCGACDTDAGHPLIIAGTPLPANARSGRSALVMMPGAASTTARIALRAGIPVTVMPIEANESTDEKVPEGESEATGEDPVPGFGKIMCLL